jgi:hypothetical protein
MAIQAFLLTHEKGVCLSQSSGRAEIVLSVACVGNLLERISASVALNNLV